MTQYREDRCSVEESLKQDFQKYTNTKNQTHSHCPSNYNLHLNTKQGRVSKLPDAQTENITK